MTSHDTHFFKPSRILLGLAASMFIGPVHALGLGKLSVLSALDEPLIAEIELTNVEAGALDSLVVKLGSAEEFAEAGVARDAFLRSLEFSVVDGGDPRIRISTVSQTKEPFLHFFVRATWDDGNLLREYTALLDPPLYAEKQPTAVSSPGVVEEARKLASSGAGEQGPTAAAAESGTMPDNAQENVAAFTGAEFGLTEDGDTLWSIASSLDTRGMDVTVFQVMIALLRENPDAFFDNNINRLKKGRILRLTDPGAVSGEEASAAYAAQMSDWEAFRMEASQAAEVVKVPAGQDPTSTGETPAAPEGGASAAGGSAATADDSAVDAAAAEEAAGAGQEELLKIVRASLEEESEGTGTETVQSDAAAAAQELATMQDKVSTLEESLVSAELQNQELRERISLLEEQVIKAQRLMELESQELALAQEQAARQREEQLLLEQQIAELQLTSEEKEQPASETTTQLDDQMIAAAEPASQEPKAAAEEGMQQGVTAAAPEPAGTEPADAAQTTETIVEAQPAVVEAPAAEQPAAAEQPSGAQSKTSRIDTREESTASAMPVSGQRKDQAWWESILDSVTGSSFSMIGVAAGAVLVLGGIMMFVRRRRSLAEFEESILSGSGLQGQSDLTDSTAKRNTDTSFLSDFGMAGMGSMQADEVDPLAEAEVYLAYGRDEQAEEVLKEAATRSPDRHELKLKLLEIYQQRNDLNSFETLAEELYPAAGQGDPAIWGQVVKMGAKMNPDNPLFSQSGTDALHAAANQSPQPPVELEGASADTVDPSKSPFPLPDESPGIDEEFQRLAEQMGLKEATAADSTEQPAAKDAAEADSEMLDFATNELSDLEFDIDVGGLDESQDKGAAPESEADRAAKSGQSGGEAVADAQEVHEIGDLEVGDLEFDLPQIPDEATVETKTAPEVPQAHPGVAESGPVDSAAADTLIRLDSPEPTADRGGNGSSNGSGNGSGEGAGDEVVKDVARNFGVVTGGGDIASDAEAEAERWDEAATKLDLAQAYLNMGDKAGARSIIDEVLKEGSPSQKSQAAELQAQIG